MPHYNLNETLTFKNQLGALGNSFSASRMIFHLDMAQAIVRETKILAEKSGLEYAYSIVELGPTIECSWEMDGYEKAHNESLLKRRKKLEELGD